MSSDLSAAGFTGLCSTMSPRDSARDRTASERSAVTMTAGSTEP